MAADERLRSQLDRLARQLADARGSEVLIALARLHTDPGSSTTAASEPDPVPPADGRPRIVLIGESAARGWPYDAVLSCAQALERALNAEYQCVDLTEPRATVADLVTVLDRVPALRPDVVVAFAGNNWAAPPGGIEFATTPAGELETLDSLADALREHGYAGMRDALTTIAVARGEWFLDGLASVAGQSRIVVVVPEFNLRAWAPEVDVETPVLDPATLAEWYRLRQRAEEAGRSGRWDEVAELAVQMLRLDGETSPVSHHLLGMAQLRLGDGAAARDALERSRDAVCGLLLRCTPRITQPLQQLLMTRAEQHGWACVDLRQVLAAPDLPDPADFHDYCHLSDRGIERAMAAVADAVLDLGPGTTQPGPGTPEFAGFAHAHAAAHLAYVGQPAPAVVQHLRAAVAAAPTLRAPLSVMRDLLSAPRPRWTSPTAHTLAAVPGVEAFAIAMAQSGELSYGLWTLRQCLAEVLGPEATWDSADELDLLVGPYGGGQDLPNWVQTRCHHQATSQRSSFAFPLVRAVDGVVEITYRTRTAEPASSATVLLNDVELGPLPARRRWGDATLPLPGECTRQGVNRFDIHWPIPAPDVHASVQADAAALDRGEYPFVLPIFGEVFTLRVRLNGASNDR